MRRPKSRDQIELERRRKISELHQLIYRGRVIREIVSSDAWNKLILPFFESEENRLIRESRFDPAKGDVPSVERLAFLNSFNSGSISMLNSFKEQMRGWITMGEEAGQALKTLENKNEK